jgi:anti-sigma regulatory factor (Ser/Thr protein kinase)
VTAQVELLLRPTTAAAAEMRRSVDARLGHALTQDAAAKLKLVGTELVANAVAHGAGQITVRLALLRDVVRVDVIDGGATTVPALREGGEDGGWGLQIVDALARRWGVYEGSTHVWAELGL